MRGHSQLHRVQSHCPLFPHLAIPPILRSANLGHLARSLVGRQHMEWRGWLSRLPRNALICFHLSGPSLVLSLFSSRTVMQVSLIISSFRLLIKTCSKLPPIQNKSKTSRRGYSHLAGYSNSRWKSKTVKRRHEERLSEGLYSHFENHEWLFQLLL